MFIPPKGIALVLAIVASLVATFDASAKKKPVDPQAIVSEFLADLEDDLDDLELDADDLLDDLDDDFEEAIDDARLNRVLKLESRAEKIIAKGTNQFQKRAEKQLAKALRTLNRADDDAGEYAAQIQAALAQALVEVQQIAESLRQELSLLVDDAIVRIEDELDDDDDDDSGSDGGDDDGTPDQGSGDDGSDNGNGSDDDDGTPDQGSGDN